MTTTDNGLRPIFHTHLRQAQWTAVETGGTGRGIPDSEYCFPGGVSGWIEFKATNGWTIDLKTEQIGWLLRRVRAGGRAFVAVRRQTLYGPRRGAAVDELWLFPASAAKEIKLLGLKNHAPGVVLGCWPGGPAKWNWAAVLGHLTS